MTKLLYKHKTLCAIGAALATFGIASARPVMQSSSQTGKAEAAVTKTKITKMGEYIVKGYDDISSRLTATTLKSDLNGKKLSLSSPLYDMAAPEIHVIFGKGGKPPRFKATEATATGGVRVVLRNADPHRVTIMTSDRAEYHATTDPKDRGRLDMMGHFHSETRDPALAEPLIQDSENGWVKFIDADTTDFGVTGGANGAEIKGTPIEPERPTKKKAQP